jgi:ERCC4-type nuclease
MGMMIVSKNSKEKYRVIIESTELSDREMKNSLFPQELKKKLEENKIDYEVMSMPYADYLFTDVKKVVERKTVSDFISSWQSGSADGHRRLFDQINGCLEYYSEDAEIVLLIEDGLRVLPDITNKCLWYLTDSDAVKTKKSKSGYEYGQVFHMRKIRVHPNAWTGMIEAIRNIGVDVMMTWDADHASDKAIKWLTEDKKSKRIKPVRVSRKLLSLDQSQRFILEGFRGVSGTFSHRILEEYGTLIKTFENVVETDDVKDFGIKRFTKGAFENMKHILTADYQTDFKDDDDD